MPADGAAAAPRYAPPTVAGGYGVVLCDPPWRFDNWSKRGEIKNANKHYPTMTDDELVALGGRLQLDFICAPDCAMIMWATFPKLPSAMALLAAWGFGYRSGGAWAKLSKSGAPAFGPGYLYRSAAELWLLGVRGSPDVRSHSVRNLILAERREHSRKPDQMHEDIERLFAGPYLELFARRQRPGWQAWGNEV